MFIMINDDNKYNCADQAFIKRAGEYALENCGDMYLFAYSYLKNEKWGEQCCDNEHISQHEKFAQNTGDAEASAVDRKSVV